MRSPATIRVCGQALLGPDVRRRCGPQGQRRNRKDGHSMSLVNMLKAGRGISADHPARRLAAESDAHRRRTGIDRSHVAAYTEPRPAIHRCRPADLYPFVLTFPTVMELITSFDFPFAANGFGAWRTDRPPSADLGHRYRGLHRACGEPSRTPQGIARRRRHRYSHRQRSGMASGHHLPASAAHEPVRRTCPNRPSSRKCPAQRDPANHPGEIRHYASVGGDRNPIHTARSALLFRVPDRHRARDVPVVPQF